MLTAHLLQELDLRADAQPDAEPEDWEEQELSAEGEQEEEEEEEDTPEGEDQVIAEEMEERKEDEDMDMEDRSGRELVSAGSMEEEDGSDSFEEFSCLTQKDPGCLEMGSDDDQSETKSKSSSSKCVQSWDEPILGSAGSNSSNLDASILELQKKLAMAKKQLTAKTPNWNW